MLGDYPEDAGIAVAQLLQVSLSLETFLSKCLSGGPHVFGKWHLFIQSSSSVSSFSGRGPSGHSRQMKLQ